MRTRLHLSVASDYLRLDLLQLVRSTSLRMSCQMLWAYLRGTDRKYYKIVKSETVNGAINHTTLLAATQQALKQLESNSQRKLAGSTLAVVLGPMFARIGLLEIDRADTIRLAPADLHAYAQAWVTRTWDLESANYVIRWSPLNSGSKYLLVCVDQFIPTQLAQLCQQQGLQFSDCKPALVETLGAVPIQNKKSVMVFMEDTLNAVTSHIAQVVVLDGNDPLSISRIWMHATDSVLQNAEITSMVRRLCAQHQFATQADIYRKTWPLSKNVTVTGHTS